MAGKNILIMNSNKYMEPLVRQVVERTGSNPVIADSVDKAVESIMGMEICGAIIGFHPEVNPDTSMGISTGVEMWRRVLRAAGEKSAGLPVVITAETAFFNTTIEMQLKRYKITNPYYIITGRQFKHTDIEAIVKHFGFS